LNLDMRPALRKTATTRCLNVCVRYSLAERRTLEAAARAAGCTVSNFVRDLTLRAAARHAPRDMTHALQRVRRQGAAVATVTALRETLEQVGAA
jgi:uncharacterized protein (DUF1778 family)